jgi:hypothetical protein
MAFRFDVFLDAHSLMSVGPVHNYVLRVALMQPLPLLLGEDNVVQVVERGNVVGNGIRLCFVLRQIAKIAGSYCCIVQRHCIAAVVGSHLLNAISRSQRDSYQH